MIKLASPSLTATADLGTVTFTYQFDSTPDSTAGNVNIQAFLLDTASGQYVDVSPRDAKYTPLSIPIYPAGAQNRGSFSLPMAAGVYGGGKLVLFADGSNFQTSLGDYGLPSVGLTVVTSQIRVTAPLLTVADAQVTVGPVPGKLKADGTPDTGDYVHIPYTIKYPHGLTNQYNAFWLQAKGSGGFSQTWVPMSGAKAGTDPLDSYDRLDGVVLVKSPGVGLWNLQYGLFDYNWKMYEWVWPGTDFAVGDWVVKADPSQYPSVDAAFAKGAAPFALGGDFGNAIASIGTAADVDPNYFRLLKALGLLTLRFNYDADKFLTLPIYREKVDQIVQSMLSAGVVPCLAPQDMPSGATASAQEDALVALQQSVATAYKGVPVILDVLNEPHGYGTWAAWKPVAARVAQAIKAIDPAARIAVGAEGYSEDMTGASADPLPAGLCDWYGWHSYHSAPADLPQKAGSGIPVWLQEYHNAGSDFHAALQGLPTLKAVAAWAWTTPGQDGLNLVSAWQGASLTLTPDGQTLEGYYRTWASGGTVSASGTAGSGSGTGGSGTGSGTGSALTEAQIQTLIQAQSAADLAAWQKDIAAAVAAQAQQDALAEAALKKQEQEDVASLTAKETADLASLGAVQTAQTQQMLDDTMTNVQSVTDDLQTQITALKSATPTAPDFSAAAARMKAALDATPTLTTAALRKALYAVIQALNG